MKKYFTFLLSFLILMPVFKVNAITNPSTGDNIKLYFYILGGSLIVLIAVFIFSKNKKNK